MSFNFWRRRNIAPGVILNLSKSGGACTAVHALIHLLLADRRLIVYISGLNLYKDLYRKDIDRLASFGSFESNFASLVREDGALDLYDGLLRAKDPDGKIIFDMVKPMDYLDNIREEVRSWSYMKFPYIHSLGKEKG